MCPKAYWTALEAMLLADPECEASLAHNQLQSRLGLLLKVANRIKRTNRVIKEKESTYK